METYTSHDAETPSQLTLSDLDPLHKKTFKIQKRDGRVVAFDEKRIIFAIESAFKDFLRISDEISLPEKEKASVNQIANAVIQKALAIAVRNETLEVEKIQDIVEFEIMKQGQHSVARSYILYRENQRKARAIRGECDIEGNLIAQIYITLPDGRKEPLDSDGVRSEIIAACRGFEDSCSWQEIMEETLKGLYDGMPLEELEKAMVLAAKSRIERDPDYTYVTARFLLDKIYREVFSLSGYHFETEKIHRTEFSKYIHRGVEVKRLSPQLLEFDLESLAKSIEPARDKKFAFMGLQTLYDRYLIHNEGIRMETPQYFWMRVSMGLAIDEGESKNERAVEFYNVLSQFLFTSSTPTLFNSGTCHPQLSSCYLSTIEDDLEHIFKVISDDAKLSKWAGGLGNDWTNVRATGSLIKGTNGNSQGVIPFLKVANDTAVAVNQGGKRKGAMCAYMETWHLDIEDFLELRKNTGDERRRTHDMNTANWVPDLFMKRVAAGKEWTLFDPSETPDLHDLYGQPFEKRYEKYEAMADEGKMRLYKRVEASTLWQKMITMLFETGHPWITFKDPSNVRSPQSHTGVVHSSNLCTEILLNTSREETAVCNLGSVNLLSHIKDAPSEGAGEDDCLSHLDKELLSQTICTAMRMLDNVVDINFYPIPEAKEANARHRPVGLGMMGFQDVLYKLRTPYASDKAVELSDRLMEFVSFHALLSSSKLAEEKGRYSSYEGSKWSQGLLPIDTVSLLREERGGMMEMDTGATMDWQVVRDSIREHGLRNSNCMAIAPTATIANITGVSQSIEPTYKNLFAKSNLSGEFTSINACLVKDLKELNLWDAEMLDDLKYFDGELKEIERIPQPLKDIYQTSFDIDSRWLIDCASRRQKWIDMAQSLNLYVSSPSGQRPSGKRLSEMYIHAWKMGLKTTYYLRALAATTVEKSTIDINRRGFQPRWMKSSSASSRVALQRDSKTEPAPSIVENDIHHTPLPQACSILDPACESCQ